MDTSWTSVVVGVDGTAASRSALAFALGEAGLRGARVDVITAWNPPEVYGPGGVPPSPESWRETAQRVQDEQVSGALADLDILPVLSRQVLRGYAGVALVQAARAADFLVVGTGRKGVLRRTVLGSVSEHCIRHASCPVGVVPAVVAVADNHRATAEPAIAGL